MLNLVSDKMQIDKKELLLFKRIYLHVECLDISV